MDIFRGTVLIWRTPRLWLFTLLPLLGAFAVYFALGFASFHWLLPPLEAFLHRYIAFPDLGEGTFFVIWLFLFPVFFMLFGGAILGLIFEPLSLAVEKGERPTPSPAQPLAFGQMLGDTIARLALAVVLGGIVFIAGFWLGPLPGIAATGIIGLLDYTAPAYARRGKTLGPQWRDLTRHFDAQTVSFLVIAGALSLIPLVGLLMIPGMVAGGTLLVLRRERQDGAN